MKIFPTKELKFKLIDDQAETLNRLIRRTEKSENLTSQHTDKSFRGIIMENEFKIISSAIGKGAFCVMTGAIESDKGNVKVEIHKVFRILLSLLLCFPIIGLIALTLTKAQEYSAILILVMIGQILIIRYAFIGLVFKFLSRESLNRLRDVLDLEWIKN
ncbi:hypothetical protein [Robertkochia solimangrovi]|uniref:hypothetical protein n=1 Tax=Robertkochia solimangrovi TaxID=2213046 RepID=UPI00117C4C50|nr:hypothetical protein [Robertkochia solimangrovi]TRZ42456.1 hypothetical protein DMZ48_13165 [Robertkochia solimangrovi]